MLSFFPVGIPIGALQSDDYCLLYERDIIATGCTMGYKTVGDRSTVLRVA